MDMEKDMNNEHTLWTEKYRPTSLDTYLGNEHLKSKVSLYLESGDIPHLLLYGKAGTGKTTLAKILVNHIECDYIYINASDENNVDTVRNKVKMFVGVDTQVSVEDLLRGIIIQSGNDASVAIAEHIAGSEDAFTDMMNQYSEVLGMSDSFFMNASGLDTELYYNTMSARDLATLATATINRHADFYPIYAEREFTYNDIRQANRNTLLFRDRNVDGMKTGWTDAAGFCLVASAERDGMRLVSVVMGTASEDARAIETQKLLTYGFRYFETYKLYDSNQILTNVPVWSGEQNAVNLGIEQEVYVTIPRGQADSMTATVDVDEIIRAPLDNGQIMGVVNVVLDNDIIFQGNVITMQEVEQGGMLKRFVDWLSLFFSNLFSG